MIPIILKNYLKVAMKFMLQLLYKKKIKNKLLRLIKDKIKRKENLARTLIRSLKNISSSITKLIKMNTSIKRYNSKKIKFNHLKIQ
jgi:hypothetical protein